MRARRQRGQARQVVSGVVAALSLTACLAGGNETSDSRASDSGTVVVDFPNFQAEEAPFATWWNEFIEAFEKEYPNVTVEVSTAPNSAALAETLVTRFAADDPPSVVQQVTANFAAFANDGQFRAIDNLLADTRVPDNWGPLQETYTWDGETQGVMTLASGIFLYYNEKLLDEAGVDVPTTARELVDAARAVHNPSAGIFGFAGVSASQDTKLYNEPGSFVFGSGAQWYDDDGPNFDDPKVIEALQPYRDVMKTAPPGIQHTQRNTIFQNGQAAFMFENANFTGAINEEAPEDIRPQLKAAPAPFEQQPGTASVFLGIPKGIEGAELEAAENFVRLAISPEWQQRYAEIIGAPAPDPESVTELAADDPQIEMFAEYSSQAINMHPSNPDVLANLPELNRLSFDAMVEVSSSDRPIDQIMAELQRNAEGELE